MSLTAAARTEVLDFHRFLVAWMTGRAPRDLATVEARLRSFDPDFQYIHPEGRRLDLPSLRRWFEDGHGARPQLEIEIRNLQPRLENEEDVLLTYEEHQRDGEVQTARLATVVFLPQLGPSGSAGVLWFHLHEVWLR